MCLVIFVCIYLSTVLHFIQAQDLYQSRDVKAAYKNGTRPAYGKPGKNYWQNHCRYHNVITANCIADPSIG
ncbi:MAG: hypothetical protein ABI707_20655 [Ferruginibacter sp.]